MQKQKNEAEEIIILIKNFLIFLFGKLRVYNCIVNIKFDIIPIKRYIKILFNLKKNIKGHWDQLFKIY